MEKMEKDRPAVKKEIPYLCSKIQKNANYREVTQENL